MAYTLVIGSFQTASRPNTYVVLSRHYCFYILFSFMGLLGGLVAQRLGRRIRDQKVYGSILSWCTTK